MKETKIIDKDILSLSKNIIDNNLEKLNKNKKPKINMFFSIFKDKNPCYYMMIFFTFLLPAPMYFLGQKYFNDNFIMKIICNIPTLLILIFIFVEVFFLPFFSYFYNKRKIKKEHELKSKNYSYFHPIDNNEIINFVKRNYFVKNRLIELINKRKLINKIELDHLINIKNNIFDNKDKQVFFNHDNYIEKDILQKVLDKQSEVIDIINNENFLEDRKLKVNYTIKNGPSEEEILSGDESDILMYINNKCLSLYKREPESININVI